MLRNFSAFISSVNRHRRRSSDAATLARVAASRLGGEQIEPAINLERIRADDFRVELARHIRGEFGFSGGGRADDEKQCSSMTNDEGRFCRRIAA